ncbi:MAG: hypothetical protein ACT4QA_00595 [Panacagrimonas sp.]
MIATCLDNPHPFPEVTELKLPSGLTNGGFLDTAVDFAAAQLRQISGAFSIASAAVDEHLDLGVPALAEAAAKACRH